MIRNFKEVCGLTKKDEEKKDFFDSQYPLLIRKLVESAEPALLVKELRRFPCILLKDWTYSSPSATCVDISDDFQPYLWKFPLERGNMLTDFEKFGMCRKPTETHFAHLLQEVAEETGQADIEDPNVRDIVKGAFNELLKAMKADPKDALDVLLSLIHI